MIDLPYKELANAIVLQAVRDYKFALKQLAKKPSDQSALNMKREVERFFRSGHFAIPASLDTELLIKKIQDEVNSEVNNEPTKAD